MSKKKRSKASRLKKQSVNSRVKRNLVKKPSKRTMVLKYVVNIIIGIEIKQLIENPIQDILFWAGKFLKWLFRFGKLLGLIRLF